MDYKSLPNKPGVYLFKDSKNEIIYVGKAKFLKKRVGSYFNKKHDLNSKTYHLVSKIRDIDFIIVDNEVEALLLENRLIKKHTPKYNINLKDSKTYAYIEITKEEYPKIISTRKIKKDGTYFGPFVNGFLRKDLVNLTNKIFKLRICKKLPKKECLNYSLGLCSAPCINKITKDEYLNQVKLAKDFLNGNSSYIKTMLEENMKKTSIEQKYEIALENKRYLDSINLIEQKQKVDNISKYDTDVLAIKSSENKIDIFLFNINKGVLTRKQEFSFENFEDCILEFIKIFYSQNFIPNEILLSKRLDIREVKLIEEFLLKLKGSKVKIINPKIGDKKALVDLAIKNMNFNLNYDVLDEVKELLNLEEKPNVIECFDISNLSYDSIVGAMVQFVLGKPKKEEYRKFEIKEKLDMNDDYASIREVVYRRYKKLLEDNAQIPNLIIIDGGIGQLNSAIESLNRLGLKIPIISIAKKNEEIYTPYNNVPIRIDKNSKVMLFLRNIRNSVHRLAISYNRKKRNLKFNASL